MICFSPDARDNKIPMITISITSDRGQEIKVKGLDECACQYTVYMEHSLDKITETIGVKNKTTKN